MTGISDLFGRLLRRRRRFAIWSSGAFATAFMLVAAFAPFSPLDRLNALVFDLYQNLKPRIAAESPIAVVDIDDESIRRFGQWPWPRTVLAQIIDRLTDSGAASIALDILLAEPDRTSPAAAVDELRRLGYGVDEPQGRVARDNDDLLVESFARAPVVSGLALGETTTGAPPEPKASFAFGGANPLSYLPSYEGSIRSLEKFDEAASGIGLISFPPARDGVVREIPLISRFEGKLYPSLGLEALRVAQGESTLGVRSTGASGESDTGNAGMIAIRNGDYTVPTGPGGTMWVYYSEKRVAPLIPAYRVATVKADEDVAALVAGRIVLIGTSAIGLRDLVSTPLAAGVPGVLVHAEIIDQIMGQNFLSRPDWAIGAEIMLSIALTLLVLIFLPWLPAATNVVIVGVAMAAGIATGWFAFNWYNLLLSPILPVQCSLFAYGVASGVRLLVSESERRYIRTAFSHYLAPAMVEKLVENPQDLILGGVDRELTILFCDIRGFTSLSEKMAATELTSFLNSYLTPMTDALMASGATIDKYMGDGIMAFWNAPLTIEGHRNAACGSVLAMQRALEDFNVANNLNVSIGIGLNTGECCVGNLGSKQRFDYSAIGDPVNVASRVEGMTKEYGLPNLISETTADGASDFAILEIDRVQLVGRGEPTPIYSIVGDRAFALSEAFAAWKAMHDRFLEAYRDMRFDEALGHLTRLEAIAPSESRKLYSMFRDRVDLLKWDAPPIGWDGTYRAVRK